MQQDITLTIKGSHREPGGEEDCMELITDGSITGADGSYIIEYDESQLSGIENTLTRLKISEDCIHLEKAGALNTEFVFVPHKNFEGIYDTPYGVINISVFPTRMEADVSDTTGSVDLQYEVKIGGVSALNKLNIQYKTKN